MMILNRAALTDASSSLTASIFLSCDLTCLNTTANPPLPIGSLTL